MLIPCGISHGRNYNTVEGKLIDQGSRDFPGCCGRDDNPVKRRLFRPPQSPVARLCSDVVYAEFTKFLFRGAQQLLDAAIE